MRHPRLIPVLLLIIITSLATPLQAQIVLKGKITTEKNEPVAFAPVILQQLPDTTRYTEGVITDMAGNYRFGKHRAGRGGGAPRLPQNKKGAAYPYGYAALLCAKAHRGRPFPPGARFLWDFLRCTELSGCSGRQFSRSSCRDSTRASAS